MNTFELMNFMEQLRIKRKMSQEEFLHDIVSPRQYQRYRNGISTVPIDIISKMNSRLGVDNRKIFAEFEVEKYKEKVLVDSIYNYVVHREYEQARKEISTYSNKVFIQKENKDLFNLSILVLKLELKEINLSLFLEGIYKIANYPSILKVDVVTEIELLCLTLIFLKSSIDKEKIIHKFIKILEDHTEVISGKNIYTYVQVIFYVTKYMGENHEYDEVIHYSSIAIDILKRNYSVFQLDYFYYYIAIAYKRQLNFQLSNEYLYLSLLQILSSDSKPYIEKMFQKIRNKLDVEPLEFFIEYTKNNEESS